MRRLLLVVMLAVLAPGPAASADVVVTLLVDYPVLQAALRAELGLRDRPTALWGTLDGCEALVLRDLSVGPAAGRVRVEAAGTGRVGFDIGRYCLFPLSWSGVLDADARPLVSSDWQLRLDDRHARLLDESRASTWSARRLWGLVGDDVDRALGSFRFDLTPPAAEIRALLRASVPPARAEPVLAALATLHPLDASAGPDGIAVRLGMAVSDVPAGPPPEPEPALSPEERAAWERATDQWDAFLVFVVKDLGDLDEQRVVRDALFRLLLRSRHRLVEILAAGPQPGEDPVRQLFLDAWTELRGIVRRAALAGELGDRALRYLAFLAAGDALAALDAAAPALGIEISADGLRRLARVLEPGLTGDPLATSDAPDPTLLRLFGFHEPPASPPGVGEEEEPEAPATGAPSGEPAAPAPDGPPPSPAVPDGSPAAPAPSAPDAWWWPFGRAALAAEPPERAALDDLGRALDRWVPPDTELRRYRDLVSRLLDLVAAGERERTGVAARWEPLFRHLVRATAWQESCWRQFVTRNGRVVPLRSETGDIGIMQVNRRVWRGFFEIRKLEWDIVYNAGAGSEILAQLLSRFGDEEAEGGGRHPARACYAAYNGGPAAHGRYRSAKASPRDRAVDEMFWDKFRTTAAGLELDQVLCQPL